MITERIQVISRYSVGDDWQDDMRQWSQEAAHRKLLPLVAEALAGLEPGTAALVTYGPVETQPAPYRMLDCTLRVTVAPYRIGPSY